MKPPQNLRRYTRIPFLRRAIVHLAQGDVDVCCLELSLRGMLLSQPEQPLAIATDEVFEVTLMIADGQNIHLCCRRVHANDEVVGCSIEYIDIQSLSFLYRILTLNLPDWCCPSQEWNRRINENRSSSGHD